MSNPRVLIVDDEPDMRFLLRLTLERAGFEVHEAETGEQGIQAVEQKAPDVMLLDLQLPGMSGFDVLELMGKKSLLSSMPVLVITAGVEPQLSQRCVARGATGVITKLIPPHDLVTRVRSVLEPVAGPG
jgi:CheY-like chemotaxis protein